MVVVTGQETEMVGVGEGSVGEDLFKRLLKARVVFVFDAVGVKVVSQCEGVLGVHLACKTRVL